MSGFYSIGLSMRVVEFIVFGIFSSVGIYAVLLFLSFIVSFKFFKIFLNSIFVLSIVFFVFELFLFVNFYSPYSVFILDAIIQTNTNEAFEFIQTFLNFKVILFVVIFVVFIFIVLRGEFKVLRPSYKQFVIILILSFIVACVGVFKDIKGDILKRTNHNVLVRIISVTANYFSKNNPINSLKNARLNYEKHYKLNSHLLKQQNQANIKNVVLVIGESLQRNYMSIYGYTYETNPFLKKLQDLQNLVVFSDTISPYTSTSPVLQRMLNFSNYESEKSKNWSDSLNILDMFKLAGYKTFWISNQEFFGSYTGPVASFALSADQYLFTNKLNSTGTRSISRYDEEIFDLMQEVNKSNDKNFYILHLLGSHIKYAKRYPKEFSKFSKADINFLDDDKKQEIADYLNSILYNDFILNEIFNKFKDDDSLIVYISDHGESVYDFKGLLGHGFVSRFTVEVPLIFMASNKFISKHTDIWKRINLSKEKPLMSDDLIHAFADILGIAPLEFDTKRSVISSEFNVNRKRLTQGVDYESIRFQKAYE